METVDLFWSFTQKIAYQYLQINNDNIKLLARKKEFQNLILPAWQEDVFLIEESESDFNFLFLINTINFSYWSDPNHPKWYFIYKNIKYTGSFALFAALKNALENGYPLFDHNYLKNLSEKDLSEILEKYQKIPMLDYRLNILRDIGQNFLNSYYQSFYQIYKSSNNSALDLINKIIKIFPSFNDSFLYKNNQYNFLKRAQLVTAMIHGRNNQIFNDIDKLTVFADYRVPQTLRKLGLTDYSQEISNEIKENIYLPEGSAKELEIRISTIQACNILKDFLKQNNIKTNSLNIDYYMWKNSKSILEPDFDFHRTRNVFY